MKHINCAVCQRVQPYKILYPANFNAGHLNQGIFSARRRPDRIHYQIVRCLNCGLIYSNPILGENDLEKLYRKSELNYQQEIPALKENYTKYFNKYLKYFTKNSLLEIGCGSGFFLEEAKLLGFVNIAGVEPSQAAVNQAENGIKEKIKVDVIKEGLFPDKSFDVICHFQTIDHLANPNQFLQISRRLLKDNGYIFAINHNIKAIIPKMLGERCPMIDIEHIYLFDPITQTKIYEHNGFKVIKIFKVWNNYDLKYWLHLAPLPDKLNIIIQRIAVKSNLGKIKINLSLGNMGILAKKI